MEAEGRFKVRFIFLESCLELDGSQTLINQDTLYNKVKITNIPTPP